MAANTKRLDLRFGSFACSVQGFDDPVMPVQQVLRAIQHLLEETPDLADAGISFDAEAIENLIEEVARRAELASEDIEITPGLVIVHRGENDVSAGDADLGAAVEQEAWARPFSGGEETGRPAYVNIFAAADDGPAATAPASLAAEDSADIEADAPDDDDIGDFLAARLRGLGEDAEDAEVSPAAAHDIFSETGSDTGTSVFADPMTSDDRSGDAEDEDQSLNLFAAPHSRIPEAQHARPGAGIIAEFELRAGADEEIEGEENRVGALFGDSGDQPAAETGDDGYTVAGLAQAAGSKSVAEMMVSAAAWMVLIQGQTNFTRRDVMDVFDRIPGDHEKTLEARIKGFGKAVRNGQIIMVEDGVFGLSRADVDRFQALL